MMEVSDLEHPESNQDLEDVVNVDDVNVTRVVSVIRH